MVVNEILEDDNYYPVLDHGFVALKEVMGTDATIADSARVSYSTGTTRIRNDEGLIRYLIRNEHWTPVEMGVLRFHIACPIFVSRQWFRHRAGSFNEVSYRYSEAPNTYYRPSVFRAQSESNKQGSEGVVEENLSRHFYCDEQIYVYRRLLEKGLSRELARVILPLGLYTEFYWKIDLRNLFNFIKLRIDSHAQWEIQQYAQVIAGITKQVFPIAFGAFEDYILNSVRFSKQEQYLLLKTVMDIAREEIPSPEPQLSKREETEFYSKLEQLGSLPKKYPLPDPITPDEAKRRLHD